jgi:hypothetical protein
VHVSDVICICSQGRALRPIERTQGCHQIGADRDQAELRRQIRPILMWPTGGWTPRVKPKPFAVGRGVDPADRFVLGPSSPSGPSGLRTTTLYADGP